MGQTISSLAHRGARNGWRQSTRPRDQAYARRRSNIDKGDLGISINQEILTAQIRALYRHTPMVLAVNVVNSGLVALVLASYLETRWWIFFGLVVTLSAARAIGWRIYRRHRKPADHTIKWAFILRPDRGSRGCSWMAAGP